MEECMQMTFEAVYIARDERMEYQRNKDQILRETE